MLGARHVGDVLNSVVDGMEMILVDVGVGGKAREVAYQHMQIVNGTLHNHDYLVGLAYVASSRDLT
jgi:hypothetical protein